MDMKVYAREFAAIAHQGQKRKYTGEDYIVHPIEVSEIVQTVQHTEEMVIAALLHDVVEDTRYTHSDILERFGPLVTEYVFWLTDVSLPEHGNRKLRKHLDLLHLSGAPPEVQTVKVADLLSNSKSILEHDRDFWKVYGREKRELLCVLSSADPILLSQAWDILESNP